MKLNIKYLVVFLIVVTFGQLIISFSLLQEFQTNKEARNEGAINQYYYSLRWAKMREADLVKGLESGKVIPELWTDDFKIIRNVSK